VTGAGRIGAPGDDPLEPEALGVPQVLDHPQRRPTAGHHGPAHVVFVQTFNNGENAAALSLEKGTQRGPLVMPAGHASAPARSW
jgi:hypothetical protein